MHLYNRQNLKNKEIIILVLLISVSIIVRIPIVLFFGDETLQNEWKILVSNLSIHGTLAFDYYQNELNKYLIPNVWMPPLYAYFLYFFSFFNLEDQNYIKIILISQILLSSASVALFYKINKNFFSHKISIFSSLLFSFFPLHLYACGQVSSISLQSFFIILFFYFFFKILEKKNFIFIFSLSFTGGLLILLRGEFYVFFLLTIFYLFIFFKIPIKNILLMILITLITISPYLARNILTFDKIILTKSFGYNLWKGNNENAKVEGGVVIKKEIQSKIENLPKNKFYGINFDNIFLVEATKNINDNPLRYISLFFQKFLSFIFIDINSTQPNYYHSLNIIPQIILGLASVLGIILSNKKSHKMNYLILYFLFNVFIFSCFFILPRYKLMILPLQIIFTNILIDYVKKKYFYKVK